MTGDARANPRRSDRKPIRKAVVLMIESDDLEISHEATTVDISAHGAGIEAKATLTPGQTINLIQPGNPANALRCLVVWAGDISSDGHDRAGLEFLNPQSPSPEN